MRPGRPGGGWRGRGRAGGGLADPRNGRALGVHIGSGEREKGSQLVVVVSVCSRFGVVYLFFCVAVPVS